MKILVVEDERISRKYLHSIVEPFGKCDIAANGEEAMNAIEKSFSDNERYDIIFLDIMLPKIDGQDVLKRIRKKEEEEGINNGGRSVIFMTSALTDSASIKRAYENMANGYVVKPIIKEKIVDILRKHKK